MATTAHSHQTSPLGENLRPAASNGLVPVGRYRFVFTAEDDDATLLGTGLPEDMRDSQLAVCDAARMMLDNCSAVCGPMLELDFDLLMEGQDPNPHAFKVYLKEGGKGHPSNAGNRLVQNLVIESHITELMSVIKLFMEFADQETALPPPALGDVGKGGSEALRTTGGASMIMGAAALPIRDIVRNFDEFTVSVISALYDWMMEFRDKPSIKGDFVVIPKGSSSLIAKEVRAQQLNQLSLTLDQDEKDHVNERKKVMEKFKASDLPMDLLDPEHVVEQKRQARAQQQEAARKLSEDQIRAEVREKLSKVVKNLTDAQVAQASGASEIISTLVDAIREDETDENETGEGAAT